MLRLVDHRIARTNEEETNVVFGSIAAWGDDTGASLYGKFLLLFAGTEPALALNRLRPTRAAEPNDGKHKVQQEPSAEKGHDALSLVLQDTVGVTQDTIDIAQGAVGVVQEPTAEKAERKPLVVTPHVALGALREQKDIINDRLRERFDADKRPAMADTLNALECEALLVQDCLEADDADYAKSVAAAAALFDAARPNPPAENRSNAAKRRARSTAPVPPLKACARCCQCKTEGGEFKMCEACKRIGARTPYCCRESQVLEWVSGGNKRMRIERSPAETAQCDSGAHAAKLEDDEDRKIAAIQGRTVSEQDDTESAE